MAGIDNNMQWPSWDELFGPDVPDPNPGVTPPFDPTPDKMPGYLRDRLYGDGGGNDQLGWNVGGQPERGPAPDPAMAPAGMVANPYYYLPGNDPYISEALYNDIAASQSLNRGMVQVADENGQMTYRPVGNYDAYDATLQTPGAYGYKTTEQLGYNPGAPWQRENDYYDALKARTGVSMAGGSSGMEERGYVVVDGKIIPWGEYVSSSISAGEFSQGPDFFSYTPIPKGFDNSQARPPSYGIDPISGEAVNTEFFVENVPPEYRGAYTPLQWAVGDISRSQPRSNPLGEKAFMGAPGGVVAHGSSAFDYLHGMSPDEITLTDGTVTTDPNPFRGKPGTTTRFEAEEGDTSDMYPGVSFYEVGPDGGFKKITGKFEPGKEYFGVRESYDYTGFPMNPTISNAAPGDTFVIRIGDKEGINIADIDPSIGLTGVYAVDPITGRARNITPDEIRDGLFGAAGAIPAGATLYATKLTGSAKEVPYGNDLLVYDADTGAPVDPKNGMMWLNDGSAGGAWLTPEDYAKAAKGEVYWDPEKEAYVDPISKKVWKNKEDGWIEEGTKKSETPVSAPVAPAPATPTTPVTPAPQSPQDFTTTIKDYVLTETGRVGGLTAGRYVPGANQSTYPGQEFYSDDYSDIFASSSYKGWIVPVAESTKGIKAKQLKEATFATILRKTVKSDGTVDWVAVPDETVLEEGTSYVMILSNNDIQAAKKKAAVKK